MRKDTSTAYRLNVTTAFHTACASRPNDIQKRI